MVVQIGFFFMGAINNLSYVVVNSAAKSLAESFDASNLIGAVPWANVAFGLLSRLVNAFFMQVGGYNAKRRGEWKGAVLV